MVSVKQELIEAKTEPGTTKRGTKRSHDTSTVGSSSSRTTPLEAMHRFIDKCALADLADIQCYAALTMKAKLGYMDGGIRCPQ